MLPRAVLERPEIGRLRLADDEPAARPDLGERGLGHAHRRLAEREHDRTVEVDPVSTSLRDRTCGHRPRIDCAESRLDDVERERAAARRVIAFERLAMENRESQLLGFVGRVVADDVLSLVLEEP